MSDIFDNAIDSLDFGIHLFLSAESRNRKHAILSVYQGIELLLKERLHRVHPILIYRHIERKITDDSLTVGLDETLNRFSNLGVILTKEETDNLKSFRRRRNQIQHHKYNPKFDDIAAIGKALKFVYNFLPNYLDINLEEHLDEEAFRTLREMIHSYDELLDEARLQAQEETGIAFIDDPDRLSPCFCPECNTQTLVIGTDRGNFCFLCRQDYIMKQCNYCGEYVSATKLEESHMCSNCWESRKRLD